MEVFVLMQQYLGDPSITAPGWPAYRHPLTLDLMGCQVFPTLEAAKRAAEVEIEWAEWEGQELEWEPIPPPYALPDDRPYDAGVLCRRSEWLVVIYRRDLADA